jgi:hypothetical protein
MYFVGGGCASGVATVGLITWKIFQRMNNPKVKTKKRGVIA